MINRSSWIQLGDMPAHLVREDTNKRVEIVHSAGQATLGEIDADLAMLEAISLTNHRVERTLIHVRIAPEKPVSERQLLDLIDLNERHHNIPADQPRIVVRHSKGDRADHFHVLWPTVRSDGRAIKSHDNYLRDEIISRRAELLLSERLIPGPRIRRVVKVLRQDGLMDEAERVALAPARDRRSRIGDNAYKMAARLETDIGRFRSVVLDSWLEHGATPSFVEALERHGLRLALGDKLTKEGLPIILVLEEATGLFAALRRTLNAAAKERRIELDLPSHFGNLGNFHQLNKARDAGLADALERARSACHREASLLDAEVAEDLGLPMTQRATQGLSAQGPMPFRQTLKERRDAIRAQYKRLDEIRQRRVDRAFEAAGIFGDRRLRRIVFVAAAAGVLLSGGGLGLALIAGGVARTLLPSRERARATAKAAQIERARDRDARALELHQAYQVVRREFRSKPKLTTPVRPLDHRGSPVPPSRQPSAINRPATNRHVRPAGYPIGALVGAQLTPSTRQAKRTTLPQSRPNISRDPER